MNHTLITPAYKSSWCMRDFLESVSKQTLIPNEILIGIDACLKTAETALELKEEYSHLNIKLFFFPVHSGCYKIRNTLVGLARWKIIHLFDADDIMFPGHIKHMAKLVSRKNYTLARGEVVETGRRYKEQICHGVACFFQKLFLEYNGFEPWLCGADSEFKERMKSSGVEVIESDKVTMTVRKHPESLTRNQDTGTLSTRRKEYQTECKKRKTNPVFLSEITTAEYIKINDIKNIPEVKVEHGAGLVVVACAVNIKSERVEQWRKWNEEKIKQVAGKIIIVGVDIPAPEMEMYSPALCANRGIRKAVDDGATVVIKTDIDCKLSLKFLAAASMLTPGIGECPLCYFVCDKPQYRFGPCGTMALHAEDWHKFSGYDERMSGYGWEDGDLFERAMSCMKITRNKDFLEHIEHETRVDEIWYPISRNYNKQFGGWNEKNWGIT